jgi:hypothetical protein
VKEKQLATERYFDSASEWMVGDTRRFALNIVNVRFLFVTNPLASLTQPATTCYESLTAGYSFEFNIHLLKHKTPLSYQIWLFRPAAAMRTPSKLPPHKNYKIGAGSPQRGVK